MLRNRGSRFDTGWLVTFSFFFILVEKNLLRNFLSVAKMASLVYERENCLDDTHPKFRQSCFRDISDGCRTTIARLRVTTISPTQAKYSQEIPEVIQKLLQLFRLCQVGFLTTGFLLQATP